MKNTRCVRKAGTRSVYSDIGWRDARAGLPFHLDYDRWCEKDQRNYENGRLRATAAPFFYENVPAEQTDAARKKIDAVRNGFIPKGRI